MARVSLLGLLVLGACATRPHDAGKRREQVIELAGQIRQKYPSTADGEIHTFAETAVETAAVKRREWNVNYSAWVHNMLVNHGRRPRGLCYEWQNTMYFALEKVVPAGLKLTLIEAYRGSAMREHHALSLHSVADRWDDGILLDAWREGGNLIFKPVAEADEPWKYEAEEPYAEGDRPLVRP